MAMGIKIMMVTEKYCDMNPAWLTNTLHNVINSARNSLLFDDVSTVHFDEISIKGVNPSLEILNAFNGIQPDIVVFQLLAFRDCNPTNECIQSIHEKVPTVMMWPDSWGSWSHNKINELGDLIDLHIVWDTYRLATKYNHKILFMPAPQDGSIYYPGEQDIDVSFIGSLRQPGRQELITMLRERGVKVFTTGGQREVNLPVDEYASLIRRSKISLNTSYTSVPGIHQLKGRVVEILLSMSLMIEPANDVTSKFFIPGEDYIPYHSIDDCVAKINYYLGNQQLRSNITTSGYKKALEFADAGYWSKVLRVLKRVRP